MCEGGCVCACARVCVCVCVRGWMAVWVCALLDNGQRCFFGVVLLTVAALLSISLMALLSRSAFSTMNSFKDRSVFLTEFLISCCRTTLITHLDHVHHGVCVHEVQSSVVTQVTQLRETLHRDPDAPELLHLPHTQTHTGSTENI